MRNFTKNIKMKTLKKIALIIFLLLSINVNAQNNIDTTKFKNYCNHQRCKDYNSKFHFDPYRNYHLCEYFNPEQIDFSKEYFELQIRKYKNLENKVNDYITYNFSKIWLSGIWEQNGVLGNNYQRIQFHIDSIYKSANDDKIYVVIGKSKVKDNICSFKGELKIISIFVNTDCEYSMYRYCGELFASYTFYEDSTKNHSGIFTGINECNIFIDDIHEEINLDESRSEGDWYWNRSYVGIWINYSKTLQKKCIWGERILPFTFDFDIGDGDRYINEKYVNNGWKTYMDGSEMIEVGKNKWEIKDKWWLKK